MIYLFIYQFTFKKFSAHEYQNFQGRENITKHFFSHYYKANLTVVLVFELFPSQERSDRYLKYFWREEFLRYRTGFCFINK